MGDARRIAESDLLRNVQYRRYPERKEVLLTGHWKFDEVWARDFAFSVPALLLVGRADVVRNTLEAFYGFQRGDGLFPRRMSGMGNVVRNLRSFLRQYGVQFPAAQTLRPEYRTYGNPLMRHVTGAPGHPKDTNPLLLTATAQYVKATGDADFFVRHRGGMQRALQYIRQHTIDGLVHQQPFEDWADFNARQGHALYTNVLYYQALTELRALGVPAASADVRAQLQRLWNEHQGQFDNFIHGNVRYTNFDAAGNLLAITTGLATRQQTQRIRQRLRQAVDAVGHVPIVHPGYDRSLMPLARRMFVGEYNNGTVFLPWLQCLAARADPPYGPALLRPVEETIVATGSVPEAVANGKPKRIMRFPCERSFSWASAFYIMADEQLKKEAPILHAS